jgi:hypothetical protein
MKKCPTSLPKKEMKSKATPRFCSPQSEWLSSRKETKKILARMQ